MHSISFKIFRDLAHVNLGKISHKCPISYVPLYKSLLWISHCKNEVVENLLLTLFIVM